VRHLAVTAVMLALTAALMACGAEEDDPRPEDVPAGAVAVVGETEIGKAQLKERVAALRRAQPKQAQRPRNAQAEQPGQAQDPLEQQALSALLQSTALEQEAADRGIEVTDAEVQRRWRMAIESQLRTRRALRHFLGGQTEQDVLDQLRLQLLTERIHAQVSEQAGDGKPGAKAVQEFQRGFQRELQERTACREGYAAAGCASDAPE
jgi:hypothetical protein